MRACVSVLRNYTLTQTDTFAHACTCIHGHRHPYGRGHGHGHGHRHRHRHKYTNIVFYMRCRKNTCSVTHLNSYRQQHAHMQARTDIQSYISCAGSCLCAYTRPTAHATVNFRWLLHSTKNIFCLTLLRSLYYGDPCLGLL